MSRFFIATLFCTLAFYSEGCGQNASNKTNPTKSSQAQATAAPLQLTWEVVEEKHLGKNQTLSALTIKNTGKEVLPAQGWTLYFHGSPSFKPKAGEAAPVKTESINGDYLKMVPTANFKEVAAGASQRIEFVGAGQVVNQFRAPQGFYLVWDKDKTKGYPVALNITRPNHTAIDWETPQSIFAKNQEIKDIPAEKLTKIFPTPAQYKETGQAFTLTQAVPVVADKAFQKEADLLAAQLGKVFGAKPAVKTTGTGKAIKMQQKAGLGPEAYELTVTPQEVVISATTAAGAFYGAQSLLTLLPPSALAKKQMSVAVPGVQVKDAPRFGHRAYMMDVARNFQTKEQVLKVLDLLALYKINVFHFHFSDDEGWRLEIPGLPELTQVGGRRGHTQDELDFLNPAYGSGPEVDQLSGSGFYTRADFIEILKYARDPHIKVIPEIETPGHARAAV
ncbi:MAG: family 20 glycosylhydrolase, partial [Rufibacter sp.]